MATFWAWATESVAPLRLADLADGLGHHLVDFHFQGFAGFVAFDDMIDGLALGLVEFDFLLRFDMRLVLLRRLLRWLAV